MEYVWSLIPRPGAEPVGWNRARLTPARGARPADRVSAAPAATAALDLSHGAPGLEEVGLHLAPAAEQGGTLAPLRRNRDFWVVLVGQGISSLRRRDHEHGPAAARAGPHRFRPRHGHGRRPVHAAGPARGPARGRLRGPLGPPPDDVSRGSGAGRPDGAIPISVWLDGPTIPLILLVTFPMNVLRVLWLAAYTASVPGLVGRGQVAAGERHVRGRVQRRLDRRAGDRRLARGDDRSRAHDRARRAHVPRVRRRDPARQAAAAGRARRADATSSSTSARGSASSPTSRRCVPCSPCGRRPRSSPPG